jgi:guanylate kinase
MTRAGRLFIISAPSGCGKTTLCKRLLEGGLGLVQSISATTRAPRKGEVDGVDYHFLSKKRFDSMVGRGEFLEHEENFGNLYGTPKKGIDKALKEGKDVLLSIDVKGAMHVKRLYPEQAVLIFILPPSIKVLEKRLRARMSEGEEAIRRRLSLVKGEMAYRTRYDHRVINDDIGRAYRRLERIVRAELKGE